jgi:hypothetical protein
MYFTGRFDYSVPLELTLTYVLVQIRFIFLGFILSYYFAVPYTVITMALSVVLADLRFYVDFHQYMDQVLGLSDEDDDDDE